MTPDTASVRIVSPSIGQAAATAAFLRMPGFAGPIGYANPGPEYADIAGVLRNPDDGEVAAA